MKPSFEGSGRKSIRVPGFDYTQNGAYFITVCSHNNEHLFGQIVDCKMDQNSFGRLVEEEWKLTGSKRDNVELDYYCIMPNHFHGIILILNEQSEYLASRERKSAAYQSIRSGSLSSIVRAFKSATTKRINELRNSRGDRVWQRNYWERILRNENELMRCRKYIVNNPLKWELDEYYTGNANGG